MVKSQQYLNLVFFFRQYWVLTHIALPRFRTQWHFAHFQLTPFKRDGNNDSKKLLDELFAGLESFLGNSVTGIKLT